MFLAAGTVGGILANSTRPAEFIYDNLLIHATITQASRENGVKRLIYLGSSCIYPRDCPQPIREEYRCRARSSPTNEPYAIAKISASLVPGVSPAVRLRFHRPCRRTCTAPETTSI